MHAPRLGPPKLRHEILRFRRSSRVTSLQPPTTPSTGTWVGLLCAIRLRRMRPKGRGFKPACMRRRTWFSHETENHPARRGKSLQFWKNFMLAGGQRRSRQRIVRIRKYPSQAGESKGRAFDGSKATASAVLSGVLPPLLCAHLHFAAGIHVIGSRGRQRGAARSCSWRAEECGISFRFRRFGRGEGAGRRQADVFGWARCRTDLSA